MTVLGSQDVASTPSTQVPAGDRSWPPRLAEPGGIPELQASDSYVRNIYKVLLTRGMRGTIVCSTDRETQAMLSELTDGPVQSGR
jgi:hypothetical protein